MQDILAEVIKVEKEIHKRLEIKAVTRYLEEKERESFYRLKMVKAKFLTVTS